MSFNEETLNNASNRCDTVESGQNTEKPNYVQFEERNWVELEPLNQQISDITKLVQRLVAENLTNFSQALSPCDSSSTAGTSLDGR